MFYVKVAYALTIATVSAESADVDRLLLCCTAGNSWGCSRRPEATVPRSTLRMSWSNFGRPLQAQECDVGRIVRKGFFKFIESLAESFDF